MGLSETAKYPLGLPSLWAVRGGRKGSEGQPAQANPAPVGLCCRDHVPEVVCVLRGLPHRLSGVSVFLLPRETELSMHQLLQHPSVQRAPAQEKEQLCLSASARALHHHPAPQISPLLGALLKLKEMPAPPALFFWPSLPLTPSTRFFWVSFDSE